MGHHQKAASCSAIPSFQSFTSDSTQTTQTYYDNEQHSTLKRSILIPTKSQENTDIPLPSFCLYSKKALLNEYALESDIIQFLYPISNTLEERLPMFVGVLQSLFTVINDLPFINDSDDEEEEEEEVEEDEDIQEDPFTIIGLNTLKLVIWNHIFDENDLCLVVIISSQITDNIILKNMNLLKDNILSLSINNLNANQMGEQLIPLIDYWFDAD